MSAQGAQAAAAAQSAAPTQKPDEGIPITDATVRKACGSCHRADEKGQLTRISFQRNTPEGWQENIKRMVALNGLQIDPATAREVVKYLSNHLGLAPEEAKPAAFEVERRMPDYKYAASDDVQNTCNKCHSLGRVISQRRTRAEWDLLIAMHRGAYPLIDTSSGGFRRSGPPPREPGPDGRAPDARHPVEKAVEHLAKAFPFRTPEWTAWSATMRPARLDGTWAVHAKELGKGEVYGRVVITPIAGTTDEFTTETTLVYPRSGHRVTRKGRAITYTGFQWRGRSEGGGDVLREVMFVDREWRSMEGRWFTGGYDELGLDVRLERYSGEVHVFGTDKGALRAGATGQELRIYGANLPASLQPTQIDLGPGVTVSRVVSVSGDTATVVVDVAANAPSGARDLFFAGTSRPKVLAVYDRIDGIKVTPNWAMARVGGITFPKALAQFEARAYDNGADNRNDTADDIDLGVIDAAWSLEEFTAVFGDDDIKYVGEIDHASGRFTPNVEGPNTARKGQANNIGDVYVVATYTPEPIDGKPAKPVRARAHLLVTVPVYMNWEQRGGLGGTQN
jgi:quinohemoprotein amine dehydrogenase